MNKDTGLLVLRVGLALTMFLISGWGKMTGGPEVWAKVGARMGDVFGITFAPVFWGFMAALAQTLGSLLIALGPFFRIACAMLIMTMIVAAGWHLGLPSLHPASGFKEAGHAINLIIVYSALFMMGPGKYAFEIRKSHQ